ncbi:hypothetical protein [Bowmanella yangjiangensis]|uniref:Uncharacterized protein n=1 Tax=Bowmanella yangjiangensis TaxID=2811230 RepID=A0ABS3CXP0_9ALTE|nr:hypothetical protein [Bowmanella yangjiangensis]MBN7821156.1 hypothetical protein [Bowmanella yangjiangensis]
MDEIEYSSYSLEELEDALQHVDKATFPTRVTRIQTEIERRKAGVLPEPGSKKVEVPPSFFKAKKGNKSARGIVLAIWPATVIFSIYYGKLPSRNGVISYSDDPILFIMC